jgi:hypothetical protein
MTRTVARRALAAMVIVAGVLWAATAGATDLRGRVDARNPYNNTIHPLANAEIQLVFQGRVVMRTITGLDGFYYFRNASPGPSQIVVNRQLRVNVTVASRSFQDLAPILFQPR